MVIEGLDGLYELFLYVESSEELPEAIVPYSKCFLEISEIVEQFPLVLQMFLVEDPTVEDLSHYAPSGSKTGLLF